MRSREHPSPRAGALRRGGLTLAALAAGSVCLLPGIVLGGSLASLSAALGHVWWLAAPAALLTLAASAAWIRRRATGMMSVHPGDAGQR